MKRNKLNMLLPALAVLMLAACSGSEEQTSAKATPVNFATGDECHVCGMVITNFPGPKGQAITEKDQRVRKFCSTKDMFAWALQPENVNRNHTLYVHDMAQTEWANPDDTALIDAREAFYVVGSSRKGAMGPTLASFANKPHADDFASAHGGKVVAFKEITMDHLNSGTAMHSMDKMDH
jgi:copper chaperone NosL